MRPEMVRHLAGLGSAARVGTSLLMYGQTEATARMAYLPARPGCHSSRSRRCARAGRVVRDPARARRRLAGRRRRGGLSGPERDDGYAEQASDLARGPSSTNCVTGDLGRIDEHGLLEIVGRSSRFAKLFGLRIDLERIEQQLAARGVAAMLRQRRRTAGRRRSRPIPAVCARWSPTSASGCRRARSTSSRVERAAAATERQARLPVAASRGRDDGPRRRRTRDDDRPDLRGRARRQRGRQTTTASRRSVAIRSRTSRCRSGSSRFSDTSPTHGTSCRW